VRGGDAFFWGLGQRRGGGRGEKTRKNTMVAPPP